MELDTCDQDAECTNTVGNFTCACNTGFTGDGYSCSMFQIETGWGDGWVELEREKNIRREKERERDK